MKAFNLQSMYTPLKALKERYLHLWITEAFELEAESIIEPWCTCSEFSDLPICCLFRFVRLHLKRSNLWD